MMSAYETNLKTMLAIWNTSDPEERRAMADATLEHNVHFVDPNHNIIGRAAFLAMVDEVQAKYPGAVYSPTSAIDMQNNFCRYHWGIDFGGKRVMDGFDVAEVNDAGKIMKVIGFFGQLNRQD